MQSKEYSEEYKFINKWMQHEPDLDLILPYAREAKPDMTQAEIKRLRARFVKKKELNHVDFLKWYFIDAAKEAGFDAKEIK